MVSLRRKVKRGRRRTLGQFCGENSGGQVHHVMSRIRLKGSQAGGQLREHGIAEAKRLLLKALPVVELADNTKELALLRRSDPRRAAVGIPLRKRTAVANGWIAERVAMGHASTLSRLGKEESAYVTMLRKLDRTLRDGGVS